MTKADKNYAFIDAQNVHQGIQSLGWIIDWFKFRRYLREKHGVIVAYIFIGYIPANKKLYEMFRQAGFILRFKPVVLDEKGKPKGNVDADLVLQAMIDFDKYDQAVVVTSDGDFYCLVRYLYRQEKLKLVISPYIKKCSSLLRKETRGKIFYMNNMKDRLKRSKGNKKARLSETFK